MTCRNVTEVLGCYTDEDGLRRDVIIHNVHDSNGVAFSTLFLDQDHVLVPGATAENVKVGACSVPSVSCWHQLFYEAGVDNTFTSFRDTNATITMVFDDGCPDATFSIPDGTGGWTAQINAISAGIAATLPKSLQNSSYCTIPNTDPPIGCAGLPTPAIYLPDMKWRYAGFRICPGDKAPIKLIYNSDQRQDVELDYNIKASELRFFDRCLDKESNTVQWYDVATQELFTEDLVNGRPVCSLPCTSTFPEPPNVVPCQSGIDVGCIFNEDQVQQVGGVTQVYKFCDGDALPQIQFMTDFGQETQEEVTLEPGWYFGDCATGAPIVPEPPVPECDEITWETIFGYNCDPNDSRFGSSVCWSQGMDKCGRVFFEDFADCPTYRPGKVDLTEALAGECQALNLGSAATGLVPDTYAPGGAGTNSHTIKFSQAGLGNSLSQSIVSDQGSTFQLCRITMGDAVFVYDTRNVVVSGGTPGDGQSIGFTSTYQNDVAGCEDEYDAVWNLQTNTQDQSNGYAKLCTRLTFVAAGDPVAPDCDAPLDPQPLQVSKDKPESTEPRSHLIEGCLTVDGVKVSAFTVVDDDGNPLFSPRPLSDVGLEDCC